MSNCNALLLQVTTTNWQVKRSLRPVSFASSLALRSSKSAFIYLQKNAVLAVYEFFFTSTNPKTETEKSIPCARVYTLFINFILKKFLMWMTRTFGVNTSFKNSQLAFRNINQVLIRFLLRPNALFFIFHYHYFAYHVGLSVGKCAFMFICTLHREGESFSD